MPVAVSERTIEPRCWQEFWNNPKKCAPEIYQSLVEKCATSPHKSVPAAWQAVAAVIDEIYEKFDDPENPLQWVGDHPGYDYGRINAYLAMYADRQEIWYDNKGKYHFTEDCGSGKELMKKHFSFLYEAFKKNVQKSGTKKTHDCLADALNIGAEYAVFSNTMDMKSL
jgi:hypothetical protein